MKRIFMFFAAAAMVLATTGDADAQLGKNLLNKAKETIKGNNSGSSSSSSSSSSTSSSSSSNNSSSASASTASNKGNGKTYYVSASGSARADGLSASTPKKDLQAVLNLIKDNNENGATIKVAEGNYLGYMNQGFIEVSNWVTLEGGYSSDFSQRDPLKYITKIETDQSHKGTNGSKAFITLSKLDATGFENKILGTITIDGFMLNMGYENEYKKNDPNDPACGCPSDKFETGRMLDPEQQVQHQLIHSDAAICGNVNIKNCMFLNGNYFAIQINTRLGEIEISNCVFVSNRYSAVRIDGWNKTGEGCHVNFHHNTVAFTWCRNKEMGDMGYGYEFMTKVNSDLHHNIFLCTNYAAIARTHILSGPDAVIEAKRKTNAYDNVFFMNKADLQMPSGGGQWTNIKCEQFEDLDEKTMPKADGNFELKSDDSFVKSIDPDYLEAFAHLKVMSSSTFDRNSAANQYRSAHGMNMQGTSYTRPSMYGNRYKFDEALKFFGAKSGYGAQKP